MIQNACWSGINGLCVFLAAGAVGSGVVRGLGVAKPRRTVSLQLAVGLSLLTVCFGWLCALGSLSRLAVVCGLYGVAVLQVTRLCRLRALLSEGKDNWFLAGPLFVLVALVFTNAFSFPVLIDALEAHLPFVDDIARSGRISQPERLNYYGFSYGTFLLYAVASPLPTTFGPSVVHALFYAASLFAVYEYGCKLMVRRKVGLLAALLSGTIFEATWVAHSPTYDLSALFYQLVVMLACVDMVAGNRTLNAGDAAAIAISLVGALAAKLYAVFLPIFIVGTLFSFRRELGMTLRLWALPVCVTALCMLPFLGVLIWHFGSPLVPIMHSHPIYTDASSFVSLTTDRSAKSLVGFLRFPLDVTFAWNLDGRPFSVGPVFLSTLPMVFVYGLRLSGGNRRLFRLLLLLPALYIVFWYWCPATWFRLRYFLLPFFIWSIPISDWSVRILSDKATGHSLRVTVLCLIVVHSAPSILHELRKAIHFDGKPFSSARDFYVAYGLRDRSRRQVRRITSDILSGASRELRIFAFDAEWYPLSYFAQLDSYAELFPPLKGDGGGEIGPILRRYNLVIVPTNRLVSVSPSGILGYVNRDFYGGVMDWFGRLESELTSNPEWHNVGSYDCYEVYSKDPAWRSADD